MGIGKVDWEKYKVVIIKSKTFYLAIKLPKDEKVYLSTIRG